MTKLTRTLLVVFILLLTACTDEDRKWEEHKAQVAAEEVRISNEIKACTFGDNDGSREGVLNNIRNKTDIAAVTSDCIQKTRTGQDPDDIDDVISECKQYAYEIHSGIMPESGNRSKLQLLIKNIAECGDLNKSKEK